MEKANAVVLYVLQASIFHKALKCRRFGNVRIIIVGIA